MIKSVTVINDLGQSKKFELARPDKSGFAITRIDGIGPVKSDINMTEVSTNDGALYNSARTPTRNIVIYFDYRFALDVEAARHESYKYFPNKKPITLIFETDKRTCVAYGYVDDNDPDIFSKEVTAPISIVCPDPYLYSIMTNITVFSGVEPVFEFPFSNESLTENLLETGIIRRQTSQVVYYDGDSEIGVTISIHALGDVENITIYNTTTRETMKIDTEKLKTLTGSGIVAGDEITISTVKGNKYIQLLRNGVHTNILNCLDRDANWFQLIKGDNVFAYVADVGEELLQFSIENQIVYVGV